MSMPVRVLKSVVKKAAKQLGMKLIGPGVESREPEQQLRAALAGSKKGLSALERLLGQHETTLYEAQLWPHVRKYNRDMMAILGHACAAPSYFLHTSWSFGTPFGDLHNIRLADVFVAVEESFIADLHTRRIEGAIVEFGIFQGFMLGKLLEKAESLGMERQFYGFDSFEGLSEPSKEHDYGEWKKGQYAAGFDLVAKNLRLSERPHLTLIKGWVEDSLKTPEAQAIKPIAYARIDVDIYDPTKDCLEYLSHRLADGAVLAFDDWAYTCERGESKAFIDWSRTVPHLRFEWLGQCSSRFYLRVHHVKPA
jgi:Macrocin-O-methyltransferase (TylF)